ncbi:hypothetical protein C8R47DRAFT_1281793 [Mycena vitilis]|nr:hypothetical protein C8R47DRAFT_1281793 [Mycena vitilis]
MALDSLPPELLAEVFTRTLLWKYAHEPRPPSTKETPLVLTLVSKCWRTIAFETPVLWSSLLYYIRHEGEAGRNALDGVRAWLRRSGNVPLYLGIFIDIVDPEVANAFLKIYYAQSYRWKVLQLFLAGRVEGGLLPLPSTGLDKLERINSGLWDDPHIQWTLPLYALLPQLVHLDIVRNVLPAHCTDILRRCGNLETCSIYFRPGHEQPPPTSRSHRPSRNCARCGSVPNLETPERISSSPSRSQYSTPSKSSVGGGHWRRSCPSFYGPSAFSAASETLQILEIGVQYLNEVTDGRICATGKIIGMLNADSMGRDVLLPNATGLHFKSQDVLGWADGEFAAMVESRWRTLGGDDDVVRIEDVTLIGAITSGNEHKEDVERLKVMKKQGLKLYTYMSEP